MNLIPATQGVNETSVGSVSTPDSRGIVNVIGGVLGKLGGAAINNLSREIEFENSPQNKVARPEEPVPASTPNSVSAQMVFGVPKKAIYIAGAAIVGTAVLISLTRRGK